MGRPLIAAFAVVLALAGAPATTTLTCSPQPLYGGAWGLAFPAGTPPAVQLYGPEGCAALIYAGASARERAAIRRLNPKVNFAQVVGYGLLVAQHEAFHVGLDSYNECVVERAAIHTVGGLIQRFFQGDFAQEAIFYAIHYDFNLPPNYYRGC